MMFSSPIWFLLYGVLALAVIGLGLRPLIRPLRVIVLLLLVLALAGPSIKMKQDATRLWVLVDQSASARDVIQQAYPQWAALLERSRPSDAELRRVDFAEEAHEVAPGLELSPLEGAQTRLATALLKVLVSRSPGKADRVLVISDGYSTESLEDVSLPLVRAGIPVDFRLVGRRELIDFAVTDFSLPETIEPLQGYIGRVTVTGPDGDVPVTLYRNNEPVHRNTITIREGVAHWGFTDRLSGPGTAVYEVRLNPSEDAVAANNSASRWVDAVGEGGVLIVSRYADDPLASSMAGLGMKVDLVTDYTQLHPARLRTCRLLLLHDVPARVLPAGFLDAVQFAVSEQGLGLLMIGGKNSFGSGGYFNSPIDSLLPVSMELRQEHKRLATAMIIVLDRSGSMSAMTSDGLTKMQLANAGAASAAALLGDKDALGVIAVDSEPHVVVPMVQVGRNRDDIFKRVTGITSGGGGIFIFNALGAAWVELERASYGQRHVILFSDASDSEEPGEYKALLEKMRQSGITVSVIGLGSESDVDAPLLQEIAALGGGRVFFCAEASELPAVFAQETVTVARSAFIEQRTAVRPAAAWSEVSQTPVIWPDTVPAYNLSYLRENASAALFSRDQFEAPLVAFWQRGAGKVGAVMFPMAGETTTALEAWRERAEMVHTLAAWAASSSMPQGVVVESSINGSTLTMDLYFGDEWTAPFSSAAPVLVMSVSGHVQSIPWERRQPGLYRARMELPPGEPVRGAVQVGAYAFPVGPYSTDAALEFRRNAAAQSALKELSRLTGGKERDNLKDAFEAVRIEQKVDLVPWILWLLIPLILIDALHSRMGSLRPWKRAASAGL